MSTKKENRFYLLLVMLVLGLILIIGQLVKLQLIFGFENRQIADGNRIRRVEIPAPRGMIYDRNERLLVTNIPIYWWCSVDSGAVVKLKECEEVERQKALEAEINGGSESEQLHEGIGRQYLYPQALSPVLGFLGFDSDQWGGRQGIEKIAEQTLQGINGSQIIEVNTYGDKIRNLGESPASSGQDVRLTIDTDLSQMAYQALADKKGAVVVSLVNSGEILVLVSSPGFDANRINQDNSVFNDPNKPLFNRAISGVYPPGSIFKIISAAAGLEDGQITSQTKFEDKGYIQVGSYIYRNWYYTQYGRVEGEINLSRALTRSTDTFFYQVGEKVGADRLVYWAKEFNLGKSTGLELEGEASGSVPDITGDWYLGNTYHLAIGQGNLGVTPLQANMLTTAIANNGKWCKPKLIKSDKNNCRDLGLKQETLEAIKEGMVGVCSPGGTAYPLFDFKPQIACKTGTAEYGNPEGKTHAWLTAIAPADNPEIAITVLVEGGGEGSAVAAPIAKKVLEAWFKK